MLAVDRDSCARKTHVLGCGNGDGTQSRRRCSLLKQRSAEASLADVDVTNSELEKPAAKLAAIKLQEI